MKFRLLFVSMLLLLACCKKEEEPVDLPQILETGELVAVTANSSASYFDYRGEPMGFQYELTREFAKSLGLELKLMIVNNPADMVRVLNNGEADFIAFYLPITNQWKDSLIYCGQEDITYQVLVQRKGLDALTDVTELIGKDVYVVPGKFADRMRNLDNELGGGILIHEVSSDTISAEDLITKVSQGEIDYTVVSNDLARINSTFYKNLDIDMKVSFGQRASWAVRKSSPLLAEAADKWHRENINTLRFVELAIKYFALDKQILRSPILSVEAGRISLYDDLFRRYAPEIDWDWRLLAALAYTESNFDPNVVSWAGARGLMQLMPATARAMGIPKDKDQDPEESVRAAVKYIATLQEVFSKIEDKTEQTKFVLAAYNAGTGHVIDAMALASKYGRNRHVWDNSVAHFMLMKTKQEYYADPVCNHGYFRGGLTYSFVKEVLARAEIYKQKIK